MKLSRPFPLALPRLVRRFRHNKRGVAAVEFALVLPFMLALYFGAFEVSEGMTIGRRVSHISSALSDLVGQAKTISNADMKNILDAATSIVAPYPVGTLSIVVSGVTIDAAGKAKVAWSDARNGTAKAPGALVSVPLELSQPNSFLVMAEVSYPYSPTFGFVVAGPINFGESSYIRPRRTTTILRRA